MPDILNHFSTENIFVLSLSISVKIQRTTFFATLVNVEIKYEDLKV